MKNFRRFLALLLCVMMVITSMPLEALADPIGGSGIITPVPKGPLYPCLHIFFTAFQQFCYL